MRVSDDDIDSAAGEARVALSKGELALLANALNEIANGVDFDDDEFETRLGAQRSDARELLSAMQETYRRL